MNDAGSREHLLAELTELRQQLANTERPQQGEAVWHSLIAHTPVFVLILDRDHRIRYINRTDPGVMPQEILGRILDDFGTADYRGAVHERLDRVFQTGEPDVVEGSAAHPDGAIRWYEAHIGPIFEGNRLTALSIIAIDTTARKQAEEALRQSHEELRAIYNGITDGLVIFDIQAMKPLRINAAFSRMLGYSEQELGSLPPTQMHRREDFPRIQEHFEAVVRGRVLFFEGMPMLRKNGELLYADVTSARITWEDRPCVISFFHDVTERKRAQEALERERRTLEHLFRSSDHERQLIAYDIHDGLTQFLAGAIMQFDTFTHLKHRKPKEAERAFEAGITMLRQGHSEARRLINGVRPPILDEAGIVAAISHLIHEHREARGPKIEFHAEVEFDRLVAIQENAIYRIVQEGLTNACKYSRSDRVRIEIVQVADRIRIEVQDWGVGFELNKIGEDSFGLEGIRERTRLLGGRSTIQSAPGNGTHIAVELPLAIREDYQ